MSETRSHPLAQIIEEIPFQSGRSFVHQVDSDQWKELGLLKNDHLLIEFRPLKNQDLALVLHYGQATLTRYHHLPKPSFIPPSPSKPIPESDAVLQGVVTCLVRSL